MNQISEVEMAKAVVEWLQSFPGYEVYQEVQLGYRCERPDIVVKIPYKSTYVYWIIEVKKAPSMKLIEQVVNHCESCTANYVSVATLATRKRDKALTFLARRIGFGLINIKIWDNVSEIWEVTESKEAHFVRRIPSKEDSIERYLVDAQKTLLAAGSKGGGYYTPFQNTCIEIAKYLCKHPGASAKEIIDNVPYHWCSTSTARNCILHWAKLGKLKGIRVEHEGKLIKFYEDSDNNLFKT